MSKMKYYRKQSRMIEGVCVPILDGGYPDFDEFLREAIRVSLRLDTSPSHGDQDYPRIEALIHCYLASPEGHGEDPMNLMVRLADAAADVIPMAIRKELVTLYGDYESKTNDGMEQLPSDRARPGDGDERAGPNKG